MNRRTAISALFAGMFSSGLLAAEKRRFKVGVLSISFVNVDVRDGRAAIDVWMKKISSGIGLEYSSELFDSHEGVVAALKAGEVDALYVTPFEYLKLLEDVALTPMVTSSAGRQLLETYVLLARSDAVDLKSLAGLRGKRAVIHTAARGKMPVEWLETELGREGLPAVKRFFEDVTEMQKPQPAILRVYFSQADICLVPRSAFDMACELNPQLGRKISVIRESEGFPAGMLVKRAEYTSGKDKEIVDTACRLHDTVEGRQVLTLLQLQRMTPFSDSSLENAARMFQIRKSQTGSALAP